MAAGQQAAAPGSTVGAPQHQAAPHFTPFPRQHQAGAGQILSVCFRSYSQGGKGTHTVNSTAAATIRQAVAILFDHAVVPGGQPGTHTFAAAQPAAGQHVAAQLSHPARAARLSEPGSGGGSNASTPRASGHGQHHQHHHASHAAAAVRAYSGRQRAALLLLLDLSDMCGGSPPSWLKCPVVARAFVLDLLEFVLMHRPQAFHTIELFGEALRDKVRRRGVLQDPAAS
jgi:hypothetical protein